MARERALLVITPAGFERYAFLIGAAWQSRTAIAATRAAERGDGEARRQLRRWLAGYALIVLLLMSLSGT